MADNILWSRIAQHLPSRLAHSSHGSAPRDGGHIDDHSWTIEPADIRSSHHLPKAAACVILSPPARQPLEVSTNSAEKCPTRSAVFFHVGKRCLLREIAKKNSEDLWLRL